MDVIVDLTELDAIRRALGDIVATEFAIPATRELLDIWYDVAWREAPRDTGELADKIEVVAVTAEGAGASGEIISAAHYSGWVNFGTERQAPQPYFTLGAAAVLQRLDEVERSLAERLERKLTAAA